MSLIKTTVAVGSILLLAGCSSGESGGGTTGTVVVQGTTGGSSSTGLTMKDQGTETVLGPASAFRVRLYNAAFAQGSDCAAAETAGSFVEVISDSDTSDCQATMVASDLLTNDFIDIATSASFGQGNDVPAGSYGCMRITVCDHMIWEATSPTIIAACGGSSGVMDINRAGVPSEDRTDNVATVGTYYFSTAGSNSEGDPTADNPGPLANALEVTAGETTTVTLTFSNASGGSGMQVSNHGSGSDCDVEAPVITIN